MRNITIGIGTIIITGFLLSCSTVKVTDSWRNLETLDLYEKNILVVGKTENKTTRIRFEKDLVYNLNSNGYCSFESYIKFPLSDPMEQVEENSIPKIIKNLRKNDIDVVIISQLVDSREYTRTINTGGDMYYLNSFPYRYRRYRSFYGYNQSYYSYNSTTQVEGITYILETLVYDLTRSPKDQLISVITSEVDNPKTLGTTSKDFSKSIVKNIMK